MCNRRTKEPITTITNKDLFLVETLIFFFLKVAEYLLDKGADAGALTKDRDTPLHYFVRKEKFVDRRSPHSLRLQRLCCN